LTLRVEITAESWPIAGQFRISRGSKTSADVVCVTLHDNGKTGKGEGVPYARYTETVADTLAALEGIRPRIAAGLARDKVRLLGLPKSAANALDCALWDLEAKQNGIPVWQLAGLKPPRDVITAFTLSLDTPENMARVAAENAHRPLLKLKLGQDGDTDRLRLIRQAAPNCRLIIDANEGWTPDQLQYLLDACADVGVELIEQPLPAENDDALRTVRRAVSVCADESVHGPESLERLQGKYDAINIKLDKTGGLTPALDLARLAQVQGFKIMVGCMLATSLAMAPALLLAEFAEVIDLDGPLLLAKDRPNGLTFSGSTIHPTKPDLWG
jgi:L-Ala-D/L-Glu epimerase